MLAPDHRGEPGMVESWSDLLALGVRALIATVFVLVALAVVLAPFVVAGWILWRIS